MALQTVSAPPSAHQSSGVSSLARAVPASNGRRCGLPPDQVDAGSTRLSALTPSVLQDLMRFQRPHLPEAGLDLLEVLAAALRHSRALQLQLQLDHRTIALTVWPFQRLLGSTMPLPQLLALRLPALRVLHVAPADSDSSDNGAACNGGSASATAAGGAHACTAALAPLLWELALRGAREALLPEIAGVATYRVTPGAQLGPLDIGGSMAAAIDRLRLHSTPLRQMAAWPGFDRPRAMRLLNALYLQSALMVSRSHPGAIDRG